MMVAGKLEAQGRGPNDIVLTLREEVQVEESTTLLDDMAPEEPAVGPKPKVRLIGGTTSFEGTLQV